MFFLSRDYSSSAHVITGCALKVKIGGEGGTQQVVFRNIYGGSFPLTTWDNVCLMCTHFGCL